LANNGEEGTTVELTVVLAGSDRAVPANGFVIIAEVLVLWPGGEIGGAGRSRLVVSSTKGWDETAGGLGSGREFTMVVVDDVTDCIDNDDNDVIRLFTLGELFSGKKHAFFFITDNDN
jgi:hypothetical protein